jgi:glycosyltransferase involved in cell wall biosynthesis
MKVSVAMITYNHERFLAQALESVLAQQVNFDYEIVAGEDCSTDRTREILMDFHRRYPDRIVPQLREKNVGAMRNFEATLAACRGEYVALLDGDDYWLAVDKLQKQVDLLDAHPDYALCCHRAQILDETGTWQIPVLPSMEAGLYGIEDLLRQNFTMTGTVVYRRDLPGPLPEWFHTMALGDWPLFALVARHGKVALMDEAMSMYRVHSGGIWNSQPALHQQRETIRMLKALNKELGSKYRRAIQTSLLQAYSTLTALARTEGDRIAVGKYVVGCLWNGGWKKRGNRRTLGAYAAYALMGSWYKIFSEAKREAQE